MSRTKKRTRKIKPGGLRRAREKGEREEAAGLDLAKTQATEEPASPPPAGEVLELENIKPDTLQKGKRKRKRKRKCEAEDASDAQPPKKSTSENPTVTHAAEEAIDDALAHMDGSLLADHFAKKTRQHLGDLSSIELDDKYLPAKAFHDTSSFDQSHTLTNLPLFLKRFSPGAKEELRTTVEQTSCPHTLLITSSGIRAADVVRSLRVFRSDDAAVSKLFAKHIKLADSIEYVKKTRIGIGIGTPARLIDLLESQALKTTNLRRIVIDGSYLDQKKRSIFDMRELFVRLLELLSLPQLKERYETGDEQSLDILVF